jgi:hypothetical protein
LESQDGDQLGMKRSFSSTLDQFVSSPASLRYDHGVERFPVEGGKMSGEDVTRLMRKHNVTIRELAKRTGITMKRIREVRVSGLEDRLAIRDWIEAIVGRDPGPM